MTVHNLPEIHTFMITVAKQAGEMIISATPSSGTSGSKKNCTSDAPTLPTPQKLLTLAAADLVTETDRAVESHVSRTLLARYPDFTFMGEETYQPGDRLTSTPAFVVDPIDGTTNFVHAYPYVSISLGLAIDTQPVIGVVYNPFNGVLYSAIKGQGAFLNEKIPLPLKAASNAGGETYGTHTGVAAQRALEPLTDLDQALVAIEWGSDRMGGDFDLKAKTFAKLAAAKESGGGMVHGLRSYGSAALNLCAVAEGSIDLYFESGCWAWDVCAGICILREAGGMCVDGNPGRWVSFCAFHHRVVMKRLGSLVTAFSCFFRKLKPITNSWYRKLT